MIQEYDFAGPARAGEVAEFAHRYAARPKTSLGEATAIVIARHALGELVDHLTDAEASAIRKRWLEGFDAPEILDLWRLRFDKIRHIRNQDPKDAQFYVDSLVAAALRNKPPDEDDVDLAWEAIAGFIYGYRQLVGLDQNSLPRNDDESVLSRHAQAANTDT